MSQTECSARRSIMHAYMFKYMHIHAYTCIYCVCLYMFIYVDHDEIFIHILAYTCRYNQQEREGSLKFARMCVRICTYLHVYWYVFACICTYMQSYVHRKDLQLSVKKYVYIRAIRAYTCNICHNIPTSKTQIYMGIKYTVFASICMYHMYMNVYAKINTGCASSCKFTQE